MSTYVFIFMSTYVFIFMSTYVFIFMSTYVFIFPLDPLLNVSTRAGRYNAFLHQCITAHVTKHFSIHGEGLLLN